jgi:anthranilate synthase component II
MKILVFDNYDSFTYNLVHLVKKVSKATVEVFRNDEIALEDVKKYDKIILSPGPGIPEEAGMLLPLIREYASSKSILGVCLGHQAIGQAFGGNLINLETVYHGVSSDIIIQTPGTITVNQQDASLQPSILFKGMEPKIKVGRYHSWIVSEKDFPDTLAITARDEQRIIMALEHKEYDVKGVQFHPESVLTPHGDVIIKNWLES